MMPSAQETLDHFFPEMRWRALSLAADLDRIERCPGGLELLQHDPRLQKLHEALAGLVAFGSSRADRVQLIFSDRTPGPRDV